MPNRHPKTFDIVILGGGFAGVYTARSLGKALRKAGKPASIAVVAEENHMVFQPMLPEVAGATLSPRHVVNPIRSLCRDATVFKAQATGLDLERRILSLSAGDFVGQIELPFRQIALCIGAKIDLSRIPGMQEHALLMQNVGDAMRLRAHVIGRFEEANLAADPVVKRRLLSFVIVGGGYSGVETAGQLLDLGRAIHKHYHNVSLEDCSFTLIHSRDHLLPTLHKSLGQYTAEKLSKRGLKIVLNRRAKAVTANKVYLDDGTEIDSNTIVSTVGNAPHPIIESLTGKLGLDVKGGRLAVGPDCAAPSLDWLWAAGDCAAIPSVEGGTCPPTAQFAMREGLLLGSNIAARICGKPTKPFKFKAIGELATIGHLTAVAEIKGLRFSGLFAWWLWRSIYLMKLPSFERKLRVMFDWTFELFFPRDINLLNPRYTADISETHLEAGDTLFRKGDPAFSFYIVKDGAIELRDGDRIISTVKANQHFGERALLDGNPFLFHAVATEPTTLVAIRANVFRQIVSADAAFAEALKQSARTFITSTELDRLLRRLPDNLLDEPVSALMKTDLVSLRQDDTTQHAIEILRARPRSYLPVVNARGAPVGALRKEAFFLQLQCTDYDNQQPISLQPLAQLPVIPQDATVREAMTLMARSNASKALAIDDNGKLSGLIALVDILPAAH